MVEGQMFDFVGGHLALGDVKITGANQICVCRRQANQPDLAKNILPFPVADKTLKFHLFPSQNALAAFLNGCNGWSAFWLIRRKEVFGTMLQNFIKLASEESFRTSCGVDELARIEIMDDDCFRRILRQGTESSLALFQSLIQSLALADVASDPVIRISVRMFDYFVADFQGENGTVLSHHRRFENQISVFPNVGKSVPRCGSQGGRNEVGDCPPDHFGLRIAELLISDLIDFQNQPILVENEHGIGCHIEYLTERYVPNHQHSLVSHGAA